MAGFVKKIADFIGMDDGLEEYEEELEVSNNYEESPFETVQKKRINNNVVNIHTKASMKIVVHEPLSYDEAPKVVDDLKSGKTVVVNLEKLDKVLKRQIFDFINGGLYSLRGTIQKVTTDIFVLAPENVEIDGLKDDLKNKGIFNWS